MPAARSSAGRTPRSDARANRERLLSAAAIEIRTHGDKVPLSQIAERAGVGVGTLYRHFATREILLGALTERAFALVLANLEELSASDGPAIEVIARFFDAAIALRGELILPLHGGPHALSARSRGLQARIRHTLEDVLTRGRAEGSIGDDVVARDVVIAGAQLAQPLAHVRDWDRVAHRQARIMLAGLGAGAAGAAGTLNRTISSA